MSNDIIEAEATPSKALVPRVDLGVIQAYQPGEVIDCATEIATRLAKIVEDRKLYSLIPKWEKQDGQWVNVPKKYPQVEAWTTMGAMLGVTPREVNVEEIDGIFIATVELIRMKDGAVVGRASAECGSPDEVDKKGNPVWAKRPRYAKRSMALTRATSKAFRMAFSWIMVLAGYEPTPDSEMPREGATSGGQHSDEETEEQRQTALEKQLAESVMAAWRKRLIQEDAGLGDVNRMVPEAAGIEPMALRNRVRQLIKDYTSGRAWTWDKERKLFQNEYGATGLEEPQQE